MDYSYNGKRLSRTRSEDIDTWAVVGEVSPGIAKSAGADSDGLLRSSGGVVASVTVVVSGSDGEMHAVVNSAVDDAVEGWRLATAKGHASNGSAMGRSTTTGKFSLGLSQLLGSLVGRPLNTGNDIRHGATTVCAEDYKRQP